VTHRPKLAAALLLTLAFAPAASAAPCPGVLAKFATPCPDWVSSWWPSGLIAAVLGYSSGIDPNGQPTANGGGSPPYAGTINPNGTATAPEDMPEYSGTIDPNGI
jgi:hypothetical protein